MISEKNNQNWLNKYEVASYLKLLELVNNFLFFELRNGKKYNAFLILFHNGFRNFFFFSNKQNDFGFGGWWTKQDLIPSGDRR